MKRGFLVLYLLLTWGLAIAGAQIPSNPEGQADQEPGQDSPTVPRPTEPKPELGFALGLDLLTLVIDSSNEARGLRLMFEYALNNDYGLEFDIGLHQELGIQEPWFMLDLGLSGRWYALGENLLFSTRTGPGGLFLQAGASLDLYNEAWSKTAGTNDPRVKFGAILGIGYKWRPLGPSGPYLEPALVYGIKFTQYSAFRGGLSLGWSF